MAVTADGSNHGDSGAGSGPGPDDVAGSPDSGSRVTLRRVEGPIAAAGGPPPVQLLREYKGLTVADLGRDEIVERLPGQVRTALHHLQRGDVAAAERALPGEFCPLLNGPGSQRRSRRWPSLRLTLVLWLLVTAVLVAFTLGSYWF